nr:MAG: hypothetical protein [Bacteriophage sp.]
MTTITEKHFHRTIVSTHIEPMPYGFMLYSLRKEVNTLSDGEVTVRYSIKVSQSNAPDDHMQQWYPSVRRVKDVIHLLTHLTETTLTYKDFNTLRPTTENGTALTIFERFNGVTQSHLELQLTSPTCQPLCGVYFGREGMRDRLPMKNERAFDFFKGQAKGLLNWFKLVLPVMETKNEQGLADAITEHEDNRSYISLLGNLGQRGSIVNWLKFDKDDGRILMGSHRGSISMKLNTTQITLIMNAIETISASQNNQVTLDVETNFYIRRIDKEAPLSRVIINSDVSRCVGKVNFITKDVEGLLNHLHAALDKCSKLI